MTAASEAARIHIKIADEAAVWPILERDQERQGRPIGGQTLEFQWIRNGFRSSKVSVSLSTPSALEYRPLPSPR